MPPTSSPGHRPISKAVPPTFGRHYRQRWFVRVNFFMMPNEFRLDETHRWMAKAHDDLRAAEISASGKLGEVAVFHCQQAAEKALKAFLTYHQCPFRKTHNLQELGEACLALNPHLPPSVSATFGLTQYNWIFRYPGAPRELEEGEPEKAIDLARSLYQDLALLLPPATRP